jgi:hypothetical protein
LKRLVKLSLVQTARSVILVAAYILLIFLGLDVLFQVEGFSYWFAWIHQWVPVSALEFWPMLVLGALCVVLPVLYAIVSMIDSRLSRGIVGKGTEGEDIRLTPEAIERAVVREVRGAVPEVVRVRRCEATQGRRTAQVLVNVAVSDRAPVPQVQRRVRESVRQTLERLIGYSDGANVRVKVSKIVGSAAPAAGGKKKRRPTGAKRKNGEARQIEP